MRWRVWLFVLSLTAASAHAEPLLVERVVARVDGRPIYLSEIRARGRLALASATPAQRASTFRRTHRELLEQRIERELFRIRAAREHVEVAPEEVDRALESIASANQMDVSELFVEVRRAGYDAQAYRVEITDQLIEQRLIQTYGVRHIGPYPTSERARADWLARARKLLLREARRQTWVERWARW
jgi:parvulin-like peptidyl-prolyl isomerase